MTLVMDSLRDELLRVRAAAGVLTPAAVVAAARPVGSPLHGEFTWDDTVAGERWRHEEARALCRRIRVTYAEETTSRPAVLGRALRSLPNAQSETGRAYDPIDEIILDPVRLELLLREMERDWRSLKRRYEHFNQFATMVLSDLQRGETAL